MKTVEQILRAIIADVEEMECEAPFDIRNDGDVEDQAYWYGSFSEGDMSHDDYTYTIQWPNLGILIAEAKEMLSAKKGKKQ